MGRTYAITPAIQKGDFNRDGKTDVLAKDAAGYLWLYPGNGRASFSNRVKVGTGWTGMTAIVAPGDLMAG